MKLKNLALDKTLPGLKDFYMIGQWVHMGGGLPQCVMSGRHIAQILCDSDGKDFSTTNCGGSDS